MKKEGLSTLRRKAQNDKSPSSKDGSFIVQKYYSRKTSQKQPFCRYRSTRIYTAVISY
jgi:hypothetical protein